MKYSKFNCSTSWPFADIGHFGKVDIVWKVDSFCCEDALNENSSGLRSLRSRSAWGLMVWRTSWDGAQLTSHGSHCGAALCASSILHRRMLMENDALQSVAWSVDSGLYVWQHGHAEGWHSAAMRGRCIGRSLLRKSAFKLIQVQLLWTRTQNLHILHFADITCHMQAGQLGFLICFETQVHRYLQPLVGWLKSSFAHLQCLPSLRGYDLSS